MSDQVSDQRPENMLRGALAATLSFLCLAGMSALAKEAGRYSAVEVVVLFQNLICFVCVAPFALRGGWRSLRTQRIGMHLFRAATGTGAWYCLFLAITLIPLTNAVLLTYSAPLWMPLIAWILFHQKVTGRVWTAASLGFAGIVLVLHPSNHDLNFGALYGIAAAILLVFALMAVRWLGTTESTLRILFYYFLFATIMVLPFALYGWHAIAPLAWVYLVGVGICLLLSQIFIVIAYRHASAVKLSPIIYSVILFTAVIDWIVWARAPTAFEFIGMALVIAGGLIAVVRKAGAEATDSPA